MRFRLKAFGLHLSGSALALSIVLGALYFGWYRWPGWYLTHALGVVATVLLVDLVLGPTLTFLVANPGKPRSVLARDIAVILTVQVIALAYGTATLWQGRPLYYAFSVDCVQMVQASDLSPSEISLAERQNPDLAPHWYSLPRWVWAPLPADEDLAARIVAGTTLGGADVIEMPRLYKPWEKGLPSLQAELASVDSVWGLSNTERQRLKTRIQALGLNPEVRNTLLLWGGRRALVVFDAQTLTLRAVLKPG